MGRRTSSPGVEHAISLIVASPCMRRSGADSARLPMRSTCPSQCQAGKMSRGRAQSRAPPSADSTNLIVPCNLMLIRMALLDGPGKLVAQLRAISVTEPKHSRDGSQSVTVERLATSSYT